MKLGANYAFYMLLEVWMKVMFQHSISYPKSHFQRDDLMIYLLISFAFRHNDYPG